MDCKYCKNTLKTISSLKNHQRTAKYCLKIQGAINSDKFSCQCCGKTFTQKMSLQRHVKTCTITINNSADKKIIAELQKKNEILQSKLEDSLRREKELMKAYEKLAAISANKSTTTTNHTTTNNTLNLGVFDKSAEDIKRIVDDKYNRDYLVQGQLGVARFTAT